MHKNPGSGCYSCYVKLLNCDKKIQDFVQKVQEKFSDCHVAVGYRDQADQHKAFVSKLSTYDWPKSLHNYNVDGIPQSKAVDLFCLEINGHGSFLRQYYEALWRWYLVNKDQFQCQYGWGGNFIHLKDFDHYEMKE